jgi:hypothetical protein
VTIETLIFLATLVVLGIVVVILAVNDEKEIIYKMIYAFIEEAEELFGAGAGKVKFAYVLEKAYRKIPFFIRIFISYNMLEDCIETALDEMKEYWAAKANIEK